MSIVYEDNPINAGGGFQPYHLQDATKHYLRHYENYMYLQFISENTEDRLERHRALKELTMCEKKLNHWDKHANFSRVEANQGIQKIKTKWRNGDGSWKRS